MSRDDYDRASVALAAFAALLLIVTALAAYIEHTHPRLDYETMEIE